MWQGDEEGAIKHLSETIHSQRTNQYRGLNYTRCWLWIRIAVYSLFQGWPTWCRTPDVLAYSFHQPQPAWWATGSCGPQHLLGTALVTPALFNYRHRGRDVLIENTACGALPCCQPRSQWNFVLRLGLALQGGKVPISLSCKSQTSSLRVALALCEKSAFSLKSNCTIS